MRSKKLVPLALNGCSGGGGGGGGGVGRIYFHDVDSPILSLDELQLEFQPSLSSGVDEAQALAGLSIVSGGVKTDAQAIVDAGADSDFNSCEWFIGPEMVVPSTMFTTWKQVGGFGHGGYFLTGFYHYPDDLTAVPEAPAGTTYSDNGFIGGGIGGDYTAGGSGSPKLILTNYRDLPTSTTSNNSQNFNHIMTSVNHDHRASATAYYPSSTRTTAEGASQWSGSSNVGNRGLYGATHRVRAVLRITRDPDFVRNEAAILHMLDLRYNSK